MGRSGYHKCKMGEERFEYFRKHYLSVLENSASYSRCWRVLYFWAQDTWFLLLMLTNRVAQLLCIIFLVSKQSPKPQRAIVRTMAT